MRLKSVVSDKSVANILISMHSGSVISKDDMDSEDLSSKSYASDQSLFNLFMKSDMNSNCDEDNDDDSVSDDLSNLNDTISYKDRSNCTPQELEANRRERNRIHAKKTRLRKKRVFKQMEDVCYTFYILYYFYLLTHIYRKSIL